MVVDCLQIIAAVSLATFVASLMVLMKESSLQKSSPLHGEISALIKKITISSLVIGLKKSCFPLIRCQVVIG